MRPSQSAPRNAVAVAAAILVVAAISVFAPSIAAADDASPAPGTVVSAKPLDRDLWIPDTTSRAFVLKYVTTNSFGELARSTGTVFIPKGKAPEGGWPVISWAHGTTGLGDSCAPSRTGPGLPERDWAYLGTWMEEGYAIVATDYVGLGTPGLHPYLDTKTTAHSVVDMVKAGRNFADAHLPPHQRLAAKWVTTGQSQGGSAAISTAHYATQFSGKELDFRGAVGTGTAAYVEDYLTALGPKSPPVGVTPASTAAISYTLSALRYAHPELGIDNILTPAGKKYLKLAETQCVVEFRDTLKDVALGDYFTDPLATLPNFKDTVREYLGMPESGFDQPFFIAHGIADTNVPIPQTTRYAAVLKAHGEPLTFKAYPSDHSGTMAASLPDTIHFVRERFSGP